MKPSRVLDTDNMPFPDPLACPYNGIQFTQAPGQDTLSSIDLSKFWLWMYKHYQKCELDDILLNINCIPYIGMLEPGDKIVKLAPKDLENFSKQRDPGEED